jgi:hypothetical protein
VRIADLTYIELEPAKTQADVEAQAGDQLTPTPSVLASAGSGTAVACHDADDPVTIIRAPLAVQTTSRHVSGGWFDEKAEVWDSAGHGAIHQELGPRAGGDERAGGRNGIRTRAVITPGRLRNALVRTRSR